MIPDKLEDDHALVAALVRRTGLSEGDIRTVLRAQRESDERIAELERSWSGEEKQK